MLELIAGAVLGSVVGTYKSEEMKPCYDQALDGIKVYYQQMLEKYQEFR